MTRSNLLEILQIKVHQSGDIIRVFFCKEAKTVMLVKTCSRSERINRQKSASCSVTMSENELYAIEDKSANSLPSICFVNSQTSYFYGRIMIALLAERNLTIDTIAHILLCFIQPNDIVKQTIVSYYVAVGGITKQICSCQQFCLIIFGFFNQKIVQVAFSTLERCKICLWCQIQKVEFIFVHLNKEQFGELRVKVSYANRALSFSSSDTGEGWSMCQRKRSASLPVSTGVSLIGLAIIILLYINFWRQSYE